VHHRRHRLRPPRNWKGVRHAIALCTDDSTVLKMQRLEYQGEGMLLSLGLEEK
jgi:hypothetical protein